MCFIHRYESIKTTANYSYERCRKCGERKVVPLAGFAGYQPYDQQWLITGHFTKPSNPPRRP